MNNNSSFSIIKKGYDPESVDAYIEEMNSRLRYLQEQNAILTKKLSEAQEFIRRYSETEKSLRRSIAESKRAAADMLTEARERSSALLNSTRDECSNIIAELDEQIEERYQTIETIRNNVAMFKTQLFDLYSSHIETIDAVSATAENFEYNPDFTGISDAINTFEEKGEPEEVKAPEFPEYPEEGLFGDISNDEAKSFSMKNNADTEADAMTDDAAEDDFYNDNIADENDSVFDTETVSDEAKADEAPETAVPAEAELVFEEEITPPEDDDFFISENDAFDEDDKLDFEVETYTADLAPEYKAAPETEEDTEPDVQAANDNSSSDLDDDDMFGRDDKKDTEDYFKFLDDFVNGNEG